MFLNLTGGNSKALMFCQVSPDSIDYTESQSSLKFATDVRGVERGRATKNKKNTLNSHSGDSNSSSSSSSSEVVRLRQKAAKVQYASKCELHLLLLISTYFRPFTTSLCRCLNGATSACPDDPHPLLFSISHHLRLVVTFDRLQGFVDDLTPRLSRTASRARCAKLVRKHYLLI